MNSNKKVISTAELQRALTLTDLTDPTPEPHAVRLLLDEILSGLAARRWPDAQLLEGPRVVTAQDNYGLLGYDVNEITLGSAHTRWVDESSLLRTQTTSLIPAALQQASLRRQPGQRMLLAAPGMTFRRDSRDRWHCGEPHQMDLWVFGDPSLSTRDHLLAFVGDVLGAAVPGMKWVFSDNPHHYTEGGIEVNVVHDEKPIEVLECGCIAQSLLKRLNIDPQQHGGLALGMGLDRLTMLRKGIPDIRLLRDAHPKVKAQMHDLKPWQPVSRLPSITRDISLAVSPGQSEELITEKMLVAAAEDASWVEEMQIKGRWSRDELPTQAISRLGLLPGQENILLRIVLRDCSRSISAIEANALYERIQAALHEGTEGGGYRLPPSD
ncbi:PheS-related mystery ligase SrmL [Pseudomonas poae]|uniref:FDX-ACB domain-containing protein n=1 Tax=Pseudomonas poae TaxID=200451 RepID=A0A2S9EYH4_9PSED|nr:hypothetical protein [Pseudomonas poae]PRA25045.1 hypothetical protein CQZ97_23295 [Pseudomonas poae]PRC21996.1 hypothetical protein CQZ99_04150 [Pseudomonas poae]